MLSKGLLIKKSCWEHLAMKTCATQRSSYKKILSKHLTVQMCVVQTFSHKKILLETSYRKNVCCPNVFS